MYICYVYIGPAPGVLRLQVHILYLIYDIYVYICIYFMCI